MKKSYDYGEEFLNALKKEYENKYKKLAEMGLKIDFNYELENLYNYSWVGIRKSGCDFYMKVSQSCLFDAMELIADYTNNELDCGCTFTMGW